MGDYGRVPYKRSLYSKGYTTNWSRELFKIHKINNTSPVTYFGRRKHRQNKGKFEQEFLRNVFNFKSNNKTLGSLNFFYQFEQL